MRLFSFQGTCPNPAPQHGAIQLQSESPLSSGRYADEAYVRFVCDVGYTYSIFAHQYSALRCETGIWNPQPGRCIANVQGEIREVLIQKW